MRFLLQLVQRKRLLYTSSSSSSWSTPCGCLSALSSWSSTPSSCACCTRRPHRPAVPVHAHGLHRACLSTSSTASSACYSLVHCSFSLVLVIHFLVQCIHSLIQIKSRQINHIHSLIHIGHSLVHTATSRLSPELLVHRKHSLVLLYQWLVHGSLALLRQSRARSPIPTHHPASSCRLVKCMSLLVDRVHLI